MIVHHVDGTGVPRRIVDDVEKYLIGRSRSLTEDEADDDDDHDQGDVVLVRRRLPLAQRLPQTLRSLQFTEQVHVEEDEDGERKQEGEQTVGDVFVDDVVDRM